MKIVEKSNFKGTLIFWILLQTILIKDFGQNLLPSEIGCWTWIILFFLRQRIPHIYVTWATWQFTLMTWVSCLWNIILLTLASSVSVPDVFTLLFFFSWHYPFKALTRNKSEKEKHKTTSLGKFYFMDARFGRGSWIMDGLLGKRVSLGSCIVVWGHIGLESKSRQLVPLSMRPCYSET